MGRSVRVRAGSLDMSSSRTSAVAWISSTSTSSTGRLSCPPRTQTPGQEHPGRNAGTRWQGRVRPGCHRADHVRHQRHVLGVRRRRRHGHGPGQAADRQGQRGTAGTMAASCSNGINSTNGKAALFVVNLETGRADQEDSHQQRARQWPVGANGCRQPMATARSIYVYAGDLQGNVWKFDLT